MHARIRVLGHPVHPMLVMFPAALLVTGTIFDLLWLVSDNAVFGEVGFWTISVGIIGGVLAALTGFADWTKIPDGTRAKRVGRLHGLLNAVVMVLFAVAWFVRVDNVGHAVGGGAFVLEVLAVLVAGGAAWLGGELVDRLGIGVDPDAHPDAPSSVAPRQRRPADTTVTQP
ncbi:DUF2231 domain-containing protein [Asanoa siamensis]|uniref:DUF2231 domain-containing protein n=1 Tax=Asanoa siamensis TaxID=926357 RepID=A0ABQ4CYT5_9ACTN|nr:DUF2231 domain-containing protein [Asanoa siamensis]GIF76434.1 hypothetical protein Asi02nite_59520 [Asanoa siamensis]